MWVWLMFFMADWGIHLWQEDPVVTGDFPVSLGW